MVVHFMNNLHIANEPSRFYKINVRRNCLFVVETWERINQLFGHSKQHTHNSVK